ncbi:MAG: UPF0149 family protein [Halothiobacillaceae bacterium]|nr:UPF0149 family protein [Halothiobacillaceae bacterium]MDY0050594.1 UPF0149 family protein [Halothiobacillaceae bacterium]
MNVETFSQNDLLALHEALTGPQLAEYAMNAAELQAFFYGLHSSPELPQPSDWLPFVLGEKTVFASPEEAEALMQRLMAYYNHTLAELESGAHPKPVYEAENDEEREEIWADWASAYLDGLLFGERSWIDILEEEEEKEAFAFGIEPFYLLNGMIKEDVEEQGEEWPDADEEAEMMDIARNAVPEMIQALYQFARAKRLAAHHTPVRQRTRARSGRGKR